MVLIWLLGSRAALATSIYSAQHACCHQAELADSCRTLCASADWTATATAEQAAPVPTLDVVSMAAVQPVSIPSDVFVRINAVNHSPPLYLQHSSLLI